VFETDLAKDGLDEVEAVRYLTRLLRIGLDMHLEHANPHFPSFYQASHTTAKIGSDNPDNYYQNATINGTNKYRIWGQRGTVPILSFGTKANRYAVDGSMASTGELDIRDVSTAPDGSFEIIASREPQGNNWLPLADDSSILIVRQTFFDRKKETPANVHIKALHQRVSPAPLSLDVLTTALERTPAFVQGTAHIFAEWAKNFHAENRNQLNSVDQSPFIKAGGDPMIYYLHGWWELANDESLIIESEIPDCEGWNFQLNNVWMESLDYRHHTIHLNNHSAVPNTDGTVTVTVSHTKPANLNWIETAGHHRGTMLWRWTGANNHPIPKTRVVKL